MIKIKLYFVAAGTLMILLLFISVVSAENTTDLTWNGSGEVAIDVFNGDDSESHFYTVGNWISGQFHAKDMLNNPYNYGVNSTSAWTSALFQGGGLIEFETLRNDSYPTSMYGDAGQRSYSKVFSVDGDGEMAHINSTNYASLLSSNYGIRSDWTSNGHMFEATKNFEIYHGLWDADGDGASFNAYGYGDSAVGYLDIMEGKSTGSSFIFGDGCGCYNNADYSALGSGELLWNAHADNQLNIDWFGLTVDGDGTDDSAMMNLYFKWADGFTIPNLIVNGD